MTRRFVCIVCPNGCEMEAQMKEGALANVQGGLCKRGRAYVEGELFHPARTISTSVLVRGGEMPLVSVRLDRPIPKDRIFNLVEALKHIQLDAPVHIGQMVLENVFDSGANVIVTKNVETAGGGQS